MKFGLSGHGKQSQLLEFRVLFPSKAFLNQRAFLLTLKSLKFLEMVDSD